MKIAIISASVRNGRSSHRVALFFKQFIESNRLAESEIIDLLDFQFPIFEERLKFQKNPSEKTLDFAEKIKSANGIILVTPEYNGSYPASLKNVIDLLTDEWKKKPIAFSTVSSGAFAGMNMITSLQFTLWKMQAITVPIMFPVAKVNETFTETGLPLDKDVIEKRAKTFVDELVWFMEAKKRMSL